MTQLATLHPLDILAAESRNGRGANGSRPPTSIRGYVEDAAFDGILADLLELVPDVQWPTSVQTYQSMRRDAKLAAILDGYSLQLRRAQWQLDGTDCRPEVTQLVADDLGIPIKGADKHGAARTRGVSWHEHLRGALTMLPFGHAGFELQAEIADGKARLIGLWDRPQHTIHTIHVEPRTGRFNGISQELGKVTWDEPEIRPDRLAWYSHQREGAQWFGVSLIRPAFAPWLLKREMQRVLATSSRRFGMGVPTVKWAPTATPTPQQFSEGQKAASAARVGDQSGLALPPGAMLELVGMSGGAPDTLGFIKWLDQQMAVSALMQHLDLGQTQTGSRALGESFIDSWTLALETIGEEVADVATRQVAARIVGWNWGSDEPVPRVTVSGIGSRREITAESLKLLLESGALAPYPELSEWVAREYRLPAPSRPVAIQAPGTPARTDRELADVQAVAEPDPVRYEQPALLIEAFNPGWKEQPRRKDRGLRDHGGRWVDQTGGGSPVRTPNPFDDRVGRARTGTAAREAAQVSAPRSAGLSRSDRHTLDWYVDIGAFGINEELRAVAAGAGPLPKRDRRLNQRGEIASLDRMMGGSPLGDDVVVYRGVREPHVVFGDAWDRSLVGAEWTEHAFVSTSADVDVAEGFSDDGALMRILVPAGTAAVDLSDEQQESELLLQRGLTLRVVSDSGPGTEPRRIDVEVTR